MVTHWKNVINSEIKKSIITPCFYTNHIITIRNNKTNKSLFLLILMRRQGTVSTFRLYPLSTRKHQHLFFGQGVCIGTFFFTKKSTACNHYIGNALPLELMHKKCH